MFWFNLVSMELDGTDVNELKLGYSLSPNKQRDQNKQVDLNFFGRADWNKIAERMKIRTNF